MSALDVISNTLRYMTWLDWVFAFLVLLVCLFCVAIFVGSVQISLRKRPWWTARFLCYVVAKEESVLWLRWDEKVGAFNWEAFESKATALPWYAFFMHLDAVLDAMKFGLQLRRKWL